MMHFSSIYVRFALVKRIPCANLHFFSPGAMCKDSENMGCRVQKLKLDWLNNCMDYSCGPMVSFSHNCISQHSSKHFAISLL